MGRDRSGVRTTNSMQETPWPWGQHHVETPHCSDSRPPPPPQPPIQSLLFWWPRTRPSTRGGTLGDLHATFPSSRDLGRLEASKHQSGHLRSLPQLYGGGMGAGTCALPVLPEGVERKAVRAPGRDCQGPDVWARGRKGTGKGGFVSVWEGRDWKRSP